MCFTGCETTSSRELICTATSPLSFGSWCHLGQHRHEATYSCVCAYVCTYVHDTGLVGHTYVAHCSLLYLNTCIAMHCASHDCSAVGSQSSSVSPLLFLFQADLINRLYQGVMKDYVKCLEVVLLFVLSITLLQTVCHSRSGL